MAAMMAPPPAAVGSSYLLSPHHTMQHQRPMSGILLNGYSSSPASSAQNSPRRPSHYLPVPSTAFSPVGLTTHNKAGPSSISSHSSSSSSSSDELASSSAQSGSESLSNSISKASARKIRFAPLPDPRREVFVAEDGSEIPASEIFADSASQEACVPAPIPGSSAAVSTPTPSSAGFGTNNTLLQSGSSVGSLGLFGDDSLSVSGQSVSTITGGGSATYLPLEKSNSRVSGGSASAPSSPKRNRWSRLLRLPKKTSVSKFGSDLSGSLFRASSRDSSDSTIDDLSEKKSSAMERRLSTGSVGFSAQESRNAFKMGLPLTPVVSESGTSSTRPSTSPSSKAPNRRGTRLLNGRVYGYSGARSGNPFNIKDQEPEFVEWGHGGMGSIRANSGLGSEWSRLQSNKKLSVGHSDGQHESDGEDDGSGMGWVKRRREQREKERKEREAKENAEARERKGDAASAEAKTGAVETPAITIRSASPLTSAGDEELLKGVKADESASASSSGNAKRTSESSDSKPALTRDTSTEATTEHFYTAVKIPAPLPKHHHHPRDAVHRSASVGSSHVGTPVSEHPGMNMMSGASSSTSSSATLLPLGNTMNANKPSPLSDSALVDASPETSLAGPLVSPGAVSVSSSSSTDSDSEDEVEREEDDEEEEDDDEDELLEEDEESRKTALSAGVEKVSKHKE